MTLEIVITRVAPNEPARELLRISVDEFARWCSDVDVVQPFGYALPAPQRMVAYGIAIEGGS